MRERLLKEEVDLMRGARAADEGEEDRYGRDGGSRRDYGGGNAGYVFVRGVCRAYIYICFTYQERRTM